MLRDLISLASLKGGFGGGGHDTTVGSGGAAGAAGRSWAVPGVGNGGIMVVEFSDEGGMVGDGGGCRRHGVAIGGSGRARSAGSCKGGGALGSGKWSASYSMEGG